MKEKIVRIGRKGDKRKKEKGHRMRRQNIEDERERKE